MVRRIFYLHLYFLIIVNSKCYLPIDLQATQDVDPAGADFGRLEN